MRLRFGLVPLTILLVLAAAPAVDAKHASKHKAKKHDSGRRVVVFRQGPLKIKPYEVRYTDARTRHVRAPRLNGYITTMYARVVDRKGRRLPVKRVMLHHVLYKNMGRFRGDRREGICGHLSQSFYGTGEENQPLRLPTGYGYRIRKHDHWQVSWMLMNHKPYTQKAYIEYRAVVETKKKLRPVTPYWIRVTGCSHAADPIYTVPGGRPKGTSDLRTLPFTLPRGGRIIASNAHIHGGSDGIFITQPSCGDRVLMWSRPLYGMPSHPYYHVLPVLHEPGPIASSWPRSATGIPVAKGETLHLISAYDAHYNHTRVMAIMHVYVDESRPPPAKVSCAPLPRDLTNFKGSREAGRLKAPHVVVPLTGLDSRGRAQTISRPSGVTRFYPGNATVPVGRNSFGVRNLSIPLGASVSWTDYDRRTRWHNATLANGPFGFATDMLSYGRTATQRFTKPGVYQTFCTLHPVRMTQTITVRPGA